MDKRRHSNHPLMACEYVFAALGRIPFGIPLGLPAETTYYHTKAGLSPACIKTISEQEAQAMWKEFKEFAMKGNVIDLAVGVIIGGAFSKIVTSLVNDLIMPLVSLLTGKVDFSNLFLALDGKVYQTLEEARTAGAATLNYGNFITTVVDFVIIAFALFLLVRQVNKLRSIAAPKPEPQQPAPPDTKTCPFCQTEIHINAIRCPNCTSDLQGP